MEKLINKYNIVKHEPLTKGWSKEIKTILTDKDGIEYLLRESKIELYDKRTIQFHILSDMNNLNLPISKPIEYGVLDNGNVYWLLTYLNGNPAEDAVKNMDEGSCYKLGMKTGKILRKIHNIKVEYPTMSWWDKYQSKIERKVNAFKNCEYKLEYGDKILDYYLSNISLMKSRWQCYTHGDYHLGNMLVEDGEIKIIDFEKVGIADPYDDFKPYCWNVIVSEYFETGLINGYFDNEVPNDFFKILKFYTAEHLISQLPWSVSFGIAEINTAYKVYNETMKWYDNFELEVPRWYKGILYY
jgi:aminoglycoside phosphotransferase (APT) family kinase protein